MATVVEINHETSTGTVWTDYVSDFGLVPQVGWKMRYLGDDGEEWGMVRQIEVTCWENDETGDLHYDVQVKLDKIGMHFHRTGVTVYGAS